MDKTNPIFSHKAKIKNIPDIILANIKTLKDAGYEAFLVGGCVRDLLLEKEPKDWDITTNAIPEQIQAIFPHTYYENKFGTVGVVNEELSEEELNNQNKIEGKASAKKTTTAIVEVTPYRLESDYKDGRHPETLSFSESIHDDLKRRDFTINALAYDPISDIFVDDFNGMSDLETKTIRAVGDAGGRFREDGLRILRAVRLAAETGFIIYSDTEKAISVTHEILGKIAQERIRDEFVKMCFAKEGGNAIFVLQRLGILKYVIPELEEGLHMKQNQAHSFEVFEHLIRSFQCAIDKEYILEVRIAALLHDIGKPRSRRLSEEKGDYTFYGHEVVGARMTKEILERLKFSHEIIKNVTNLVRWHMFFSDPSLISLSAVRRMVINVGKENIWELMNLRVCDRVGTGRPKEDPYRLRKYISMIEEVLRDPISVGMLKIDGNTIIKTLGVTPGPAVGFMLNILLEEVLEDPKLNTEEYLVSQVTKLSQSPIEELKKMSEKAIELKNTVEEGELDTIKEKYRVK